MTSVGSISGAMARSNVYPFPGGAGVQPGKPVSADVLRFSGNKIRVLSYNAGKFYGPQANPREAAKHDIYEKPKESVRALAKVVLDNNPDILALQEVESATVLKNFNNSYLGGKYPNIVIYPTNDKWGTHVAFMSKNTVKLVDSKSHRRMINCDRNRPVFTRDFLEATYETSSGYRMTLFNTHFMSMRKGERKTHPVRLDEARAGALILANIFRRDPEARVMVLGDLNTLSYTPQGQEVLKALMGQEDRDKANDLADVFVNKKTQGPTHWGHGKNSDDRLDYAFASAKLMLEVVAAKVIGFFTKDPWQKASDHLPLLVEVEEPDTVTKSDAGAVEPVSEVIDPQANLIERLMQGGQNRGRFQRPAPTYSDGAAPPPDLAEKLAPKRKSRFQRFA